MKMKVAEYRRLYDRLSYAFSSLRGCRLDERPREADWVRRAARDLMNAECPTAKPDDRQIVERLLDSTASYLIEHGLTGTAADSMRV